MRLPVKVVPGASRSRIAGWLGEALRICVVAPPERGKANAEVEALLAEALDLGPQQVRIVAGATGARKIVEIDGMDEAELRARLEQEQA